MNAQASAARSQQQRDRTRLEKEKLQLHKTIDGMSALAGTPAIDSVLAPKRRRLKVVEDSLGAMPKTPGAPLTPTPAGSGPVASAPPVLQLPGTRRDDDDDAHAPTVPEEWLQHADENPDYAAYLEMMGVQR
jgi:hypothetical protein